MGNLEAAVLGLIQGLTEFLPVSSSGHLVIFEHLLGVKQPGVTFEVAVHLGTLLSVLVAFWEDIWQLLRHPFCRLTYLIIIGTIPAGLLGYFLAPWFVQAFESLLVVGVGLLITGCFLMIGEKMATRNWFVKEAEAMSTGDALFVGVLQGLAITPGISRSGSTIAAGLFRGLDQEFAARFSFLLSIPVILGAGLLEAKDLVGAGLIIADATPYIIGIVTSAGFGYLAIRIVLNLVKRGRLSLFSYYCWAVGLMTLIAYFW